MNLKELQQQPIYWKVIDSTYLPCKEKREMIGGIYEEYIYYQHLTYGISDSKTVTLWKDKKEDECWVFNLSDLQEATPLLYKGERICIGDEVGSFGEWYEVYDYTWADGDWRVLTTHNKNYNNNDTHIFSEDEIQDHKPLHPQTKETIEIGGQLYSKEEVENKLKDLKPIK